MANTDLKSMLNDPVGTFGQPAAVLERGDLSHAEKRSILERWRHEARSNTMSGTDSAPIVAEIERTLEGLADEPDDAGKVGHGIIAVFHDRAQLERTIDLLQGAAVNRANITLLTQQPGRGDVHAGDETSKPVDRGEESNIGGLVAGMPTYLGAVVAAGVTAASGGILAGVALAAVGGAAAGGALGGTAARLLKNNVDATYEQQMASGGIVILVVPRDAEEASRVRDILTEQGAMDVREQTLDH